MRWRSATGAVVLATGVLACTGRSRGPRAPEPPAPETTLPLSMALLGGSEGSVTSSDSIDRLLQAPEVTAAGDRVMQRLGNDPSLAPLYEGFISGLLTQPAMLKALAALAQSAPGVSVDELTDRVVTQLAAGLDGPVFDAALGESLDRVLDRPDVDAAFSRLAETILQRARFVDRLGALLLQWQPELEATVGVPMNHEDFPDRLKAHVEQPARNRALHELVGERLVTDQGIRDGLAALLDHEVFYGACARLVQSLLQSPDFDTNTTLIFVGMLESVDTVQMGQRIDRVLVTPVVERAVVTWADEIIASDALARFADQLGEALDDPNFQAELFDVLVGASAGPIARRSAEVTPSAPPV